MSKTKQIRAQVEIEIPFFDVDSMEITWHGNYIKYFELARCKLLDKLDYSYENMCQSGYAWPIVDMRIKYIKPTRFNQKIIVNAYLVEYENRLKIEYVVYDAKNIQLKLTYGYSIQIAVDMKTKKTCFLSPAILLKKVVKLL